MSRWLCVDPALQKSLDEAIEEGDVLRVQATLANGADPNHQRAPNDGDARPLYESFFRTPLDWAAYHGRTDVVETLVAAGARLPSRDPSRSRHRITCAILGKSSAMAQCFFDRRILLTKRDRESRLRHAAAIGGVEIVKFYLDHGAEINSYRDLDQMTALMSAAANGRSDVVCLLLERGADPTLRSIDLGGLQISALGHALYSRDVETIQLLIDTTSDLTETNIFARTSYFIIKHERGPELLKLMLEHGADPNARYDGGTPLIRASKLASLECVDLLLAHGADVNATDDDGKTALDWSARSAITTLLVDAGGVC